MFSFSPLLYLKPVLQLHGVFSHPFIHPVLIIFFLLRGEVPPHFVHLDKTLLSIWDFIFQMFHLKFTENDVTRPERQKSKEDVDTKAWLDWMNECWKAQSVDSCTHWDGILGSFWSLVTCFTALTCYAVRKTIFIFFF